MQTFTSLPRDLELETRIVMVDKSLLQNSSTSSCIHWSIKYIARLAIFSSSFGMPWFVSTTASIANGILYALSYCKGSLRNFCLSVLNNQVLLVTEKDLGILSVINKQNCSKLPIFLHCRTSALLPISYLIFAETCHLSSTPHLVVEVDKGRVDLDIRVWVLVMVNSGAR